ncbi:uncharacterized protein LOC128095414 [Peromyscus californicus insignis]|uniref:uncharacterized protein LOC128095414 n=1 Tax=Peromyscus californicus insignis TaxID=564181 RepID=UPI0022A6D5F1|nr:uncharacterized protein LOC128095414 [Peromyscus californicus insignis]
MLQGSGKKLPPQVEPLHSDPEEVQLLPSHCPPPPGSTHVTHHGGHAPPLGAAPLRPPLSRKAFLRPREQVRLSSNLEFPHWPERGCPSQRRGGDPPPVPIGSSFPQSPPPAERSQPVRGSVGEAGPPAPPAARSPGQPRRPPVVSDQLQPGPRAPLARPPSTLPRLRPRPSRLPPARPPAAAARSAARRAQEAPREAGCGEATGGPALRTATTAARDLRPESPGGGGRPSRRGR